MLKLSASFSPRWLLLALALPLLPGVKAKDIVLEDFEGADFGKWESTGTAFGTAPAKGAIQGQMPVSGFEGAGFASSFHGGDDAKGTLTSPAFEIQKPQLNFLIGGGGFAGETCVELIVDGMPKRTATGPNTAPGGSEQLRWTTWDVSDLKGKKAIFRIVDSKTGGWGHISVDQIYQSDQPAIMQAHKELTINARYLVWPIKRDSGEKHRFTLTLAGETSPLAFSDIALTDKPDFYAFTDLADYQGKTLTLTATLPSQLAAAWDEVRLQDSYPGEENLYREPNRPQIHFTSRRGWLNDPNGLVFFEGKWHLFYQHNPYNNGWDNMHWGHAVSDDLLHWKELPNALFPDAEGYMFSGSGFVAGGSRPVSANVSALAENPGRDREFLALAYTSEGTFSPLGGLLATQSLAVSSDAGKTFRKFPENPVMPHIVGGNRDPKIFWHEPTKHWIMALYHDGDTYGIHRSQDLVSWEETCLYHIPGDAECPDLFELPVNGDSAERKWVAWAAKGTYRIGTFDGKEFKPETDSLRHYFGSAYAGQSYDNAPDGRRVHFGWMRDGGRPFGEAPFNLQMTVPMDFTLRRDSSGAIRLHAEASRELRSLRADSKEWRDLTVRENTSPPWEDFSSGAFEIEAEIDAAAVAEEIGFEIFGHPVIWRKSDQSLTGAEGPQEPVEGTIRFHIIVDTASVEAFVNGTYTSAYIPRPQDKPAVFLKTGGAETVLKTLSIHKLKSAWE